MNARRRRYVNLRSIGMSLFNKKEDADQAPVEKKAEEPAAGKGRPTPKRKDAQAQNLRPLVPKDREASRKAAKARMRERENAEYDAMQKGDINHMPKAERLPWRIYIRDYVDARFNLGEFFIPVAFVILIGSIFVTYQWPALALPLMVLMYVYLFAVIIDVVQAQEEAYREVRRAVRGQGHAFRLLCVESCHPDASLASAEAALSEAWTLAGVIGSCRESRPSFFQAVGENRRLFHYHVTSCNARINEDRHD